MKNAWIAYVLMTTASTSATTTRIGNSRQNDRFLRGRRPVDPAVRRPPAPDPACSELTDDASSSDDVSAAPALAAPALAALALAALALATRPARQAERRGHRDLNGSRRPTSLVGVHRHQIELSAISGPRDR